MPPLLNAALPGAPKAKAPLPAERGVGGCCRPPAVGVCSAANPEPPLPAPTGVDGWGPFSAVGVC